MDNLTVEDLRKVLAHAPSDAEVDIGFESVCHRIGKVLYDPSTNSVELRDVKDFESVYPSDKDLKILWEGRPEDDDD